MISTFRGQYSFLSNFYPCKIVDKNGAVWPSSEHAYQAMKSNDPQVREFIRTHPLKGLKAAARRIQIRPDWGQIKISIMTKILNHKFAIEELRQLLLSTGTEELKEGNYWHDNFWGSCTCNQCGDQGQNQLGRILMDIRANISE